MLSLPSPFLWQRSIIHHGTHPVSPNKASGLSSCSRLAAIPRWSDLVGSWPSLILMLAVSLDLHISPSDLLNKLHYQLVAFSKSLPQIPIFLPIWMQIFPFMGSLYSTSLPAGTQTSPAVYIVCGSHKEWLDFFLDQSLFIPLEFVFRSDFLS